MCENPVSFRFTLKVADTEETVLAPRLETVHPCQIFLSLSWKMGQVPV